MTTVLLAMLIPIAVLTALAWLVRRTVLPHLCPLCAGVTGTWIGLLVLLWAGVALDPRLPALLMGGTVVGLAGLGERALTVSGGQILLLWKTVFVLVGMATAYLLLQSAWAAATGGSLLLAVLLAMVWLPARRAPASLPTRRSARLLEQLKHCC